MIILKEHVISDLLRLVRVALILASSFNVGITILTKIFARYCYSSPCLWVWVLVVVLLLLLLIAVLVASWHVAWAWVLLVLGRLALLGLVPLAVSLHVP